MYQLCLYFSFLRLLNRSIRISFLDAAIWILSDTRSIREKNILLATGIFYCFHTILFDSLDCAVCKYALFFSVSKDTFDSTIWENDFFCSVREMLLDLAIRKLEDLESVSIGGLSCFGLSKIVDDLLVRISLLNVVIIEIYNRIAIWERLSSNSVWENDFFFAIQECSLDFSVVAHDLLLHSCVIWVLLVMVHIWEFHLVIFLVILFVLLISLGLWNLLVIFRSNIVFNSFIIVNIDIILLSTTKSVVYLLLLLFEFFNAILPINRKLWRTTQSCIRHWSLLVRRGRPLLTSSTAASSVEDTGANTRKLWLWLMVDHRILVDTLICIFLGDKILLTHFS